MSSSCEKPHIGEQKVQGNRMDFDYVVMPAFILVVALLMVWICVRRMRSLSAKGYRVWRKVTERVVLSFTVLLAIVLGGSSSFNAIRLYCFRAANPPPGILYTVDGRKMRINCTGSGSPTIILEAGSGGDGLVWGGVQPVLSRTTRVCSYDRAGLGWSEPRPRPRDADRIVSELHELLLSAHVTGPIVLMGHSRGGIYIRDYASRYPADVAGFVFVDSATPSPSRSHGLNQPLIMTMMGRPLFILGIPRLLSFCSQPKPGFDARTGILQREDLCHTDYGTVLDELEGLEQSDQRFLPASYGELPILILSHDPSFDRHSCCPQEGMVRLSMRSQQIIANGSGHYIQFDRPDLIEREVPLFIEKLRGTAPWPAVFGSTTTE